VDLDTEETKFDASVWQSPRPEQKNGAKRSPQAKPLTQQSKQYFMKAGSPGSKQTESPVKTKPSPKKLAKILSA